MTVSNAIVRAKKGGAKLLWGTRVVGILPALAGLVRLGAMRVRRRPRELVHLRSGPALEFAYPRQVVPALVVFGDYIDPEFAFLRRISRPDWIVLDIGAAIGQFSVFAATLPARHVYAFEPSSDNIVTLNANLARNEVADRVTVVQMALSHSDCDMTFPTLDNPYLSRLDHAEGAVAGETVAVRTLPHALAEIGVDRIDCLKLNVAGFESEVIDGAQDFLARQGADVLIILISEGSLPWLPKIASLGYRFYFFHPKQNRLYAITDFDGSGIHDRPWPARHVIALSEDGVGRGLLRGLTVAEGPS